MDNDTIDAQPITQRPVSSRPSPSPAHHRLNENYPMYDEEIDEDQFGAVGGAPRPRGYTGRILTEDERRVGDEARQILEWLIEDQAENDHVPEEQRNILRNDVLQTDRKKRTSESYREVAVNLRKAADDLDANENFKRATKNLPLHFSKKLFMKVWEEIFKNNKFTWGKIGTLFYFVYKQLIQTVAKELSAGIPWMRELISWVMEFFGRKIADWIIARGGWNMIVEWFGMSRDQFFALAAASLLAFWYWGRK